MSAEDLVELCDGLLELKLQLLLVPKGVVYQKLNTIFAYSPLLGAGEAGRHHGQLTLCLP